MIIYIKTIGYPGKTIKSNVYDCEKFLPITELKKKIYHELNIDPIYQNLIYCGKIMKSFNLIYDYIKPYDNPIVYLRINHELKNNLELQSCKRKLEFSKLLNTRLNKNLINENLVNAFTEYLQDSDISKQIYKYYLLKERNNEKNNEKISIIDSKLLDI
tara:strand:+ start:70 stop:546 length:477 start_codon:yes stop_codon:yes gene_type:complete